MLYLVEPFENMLIYSHRFAALVRSTKNIDTIAVSCRISVRGYPSRIEDPYHSQSMNLKHYGNPRQW